MIQTSDAYKQAIKNGAPQKCLFLFREANTYFTNEDILIGSGGVRFTEPFNTETDMSIGQCPSASLRFTLDNSTGLLNDFEFGEYEAAIGVRTGKSRYETTDKLAVVLNDGAIVSFNENGLFYNGAKTVSQPNMDAAVLIVDGNYVYTWSKQDGAWRGTISGRNITNGRKVETNAFMSEKMKRRTGVSIYRNGNMVTEWSSGEKTTWEYVPLGVFIANRPNQSRKKTISVSSNDKMLLFDEELGDVTYPITVLSLVEQICEEVGVTLGTRDFSGASRIISSEPDDFDGATMRDVLGWVAELACANARMGRDGKLQFDWFAQTEHVVTEANQKSYDPYWYETNKIDKVVVRNYDVDDDVEIGDGNNAYLIKDNPILGQNTTVSAKTNAADASADADEQAIYDRLSGTTTFHPATAETFEDWSIQAGDIVSVESEGATSTMPVYNLSMTWSGSPVTTLESTGNQTRKTIETREERQNQSIARSAYNKSSENDEYIQVIAHAIVGDEDDPMEALLAITSDGFLQTVAKNDMKSIFTQTYKGFKLVGDEIELDGYTLATSLYGQSIDADSLSANAARFAHFDAGSEDEACFVHGLLETAALLVTGDVIFSQALYDTRLRKPYLYAEPNTDEKIMIVGPTEINGTLNVYNTLTAGTAVIGGTTIVANRWENVTINGKQYRLLKVDYT